MAYNFESHPPVVARQSGNGMRRGGHIPWFNPREMDDETVLSLNTGRDALLMQFFKAVHKRLAHPGIFSHWLLTGTRGAGKSFFLRLVQVSFQAAVRQQARFVLLPEEHRNIYAPHEFLAEIQRLLNIDQGADGTPPAWRTDNTAQAWDKALAGLLQSYAEPLLVIGVENFDQLLAQAFSDETDNSRLRHLMSNESRIMLLATAVQGDFDENYNQRLFRQFEHHPIPRWDADDHRDYLMRRAQREGKKPTPLQLARIDAYSRYTGGNARAAAVLAGTLLDENDPLQAAEYLDAAIEKMSDYYRNLIERIPVNTRKLFDALVRGGEPASQTEIAERTGARQNDISRAFMWLVDQGYVGESRLPGQKTKQYRVLDRLFVQFYRMRSISPSQRSKLALMAELLADTLAFQDKWHFASRYTANGHGHEARTLMELALKERMVDIKLLPATESDKLCALGTGWTDWDAILEIPEDSDGMARYKEIVRRYPDDQCLSEAIKQASILVRAAGREEVPGVKLVPLLEGSLSLCPIEKFYLLLFLLSAQSNRFQWSELTKIFQNEVADINKLKETHPDSFAKIRTWVELGRTYPRTVSLSSISQEAMRGKDRYKDLELETAADWAAQAALSWLKAKQASQAAASLEICIEAPPDLSDTDFSTETPVKIAALIKPSRAAPFLYQRTVDVYEYNSGELEQQRLFLEAYQPHVIARNEQNKVCQPRATGWNLEKTVWHQDALDNFSLAFVENRLAFEERVAQKWFEGAAWNLGQMARFSAGQSGGEAAWGLLDNEIGKIGGNTLSAIQQLGDAISDHISKQGEAAAFALGCDLLQGLAERPQFPAEAALRAMWINMIDMGVPHGLLRDLLGEWKHLFGVRFDPGMNLLNQLLHGWLDDLDTPAETRKTRRLTLDPDLATTLSALEEGLSPQARRRLGLIADL